MKEILKLNRLILNNWGSSDHFVVDFDGTVTMIVGPNGSGKTTIADAMLCVICANTDPRYFNQAQQDGDKGTSERSILEYARGATKHYGAKRAKQRFYTNVVAEWHDLAKNIYYCTGIIVEVTSTEDRKTPPHKWFTLNGAAPDDEFLNYTYEDFEKLVKERSAGLAGIAPPVSAIYSQTNAYKAVLKDKIYGNVDMDMLFRLMMSAIKMDLKTDINTFIKTFLFPHVPDLIGKKLAEKASALREIIKRLERNGEKRDELKYLCDLIKAYNKANSDCLMLNEEILYIKNILAERQRDRLLETVGEISKKIEDSKTALDELKQKRNLTHHELVQLQSALSSSDFDKKKKELNAKKDICSMKRGELNRAQKIKEHLRAWCEDPIVSSYLAEQDRELIRNYLSDKVDEESLKAIADKISEVTGTLLLEYDKQALVVQDLERKRDALAEEIQNIEHDRRRYRQPDLFRVVETISERLKTAHGRDIPVEIFSRTFDILEPEWKDAIEGSLSQKSRIILPPEYVDEAVDILQALPNTDRIRIIDTKGIERSVAKSNRSYEGTLYECVSKERDYIDLALKRYLGRIKKCHTKEELRQSGNGVTPDCLSYFDHSFGRIPRDTYTKYASIGKQIPQSIVEEKKRELVEMENDITIERSRKLSVHSVSNYKAFDGADISLILDFAHVPQEIKQLEQEINALAVTISQLENGEIKRLEQTIKEKDAALEKYDEDVQELQGVIAQQNASLKTTNENVEAANEFLDKCKKEHSDAFEEVVIHAGDEWMERNKTVIRPDTVDARFSDEVEELSKIRYEREVSLKSKKVRFTEKYIGTDIDDTLASNDQVLKEYEEARRNYDEELVPAYKTLYEDTRKSMQKEVIDILHQQMRSALQRKSEINMKLRETPFGPSKYELHMSKADGRDGDYYDMLMADSLTFAPDFESEQIMLGEQNFMSEFGDISREFMELFAPPNKDDFPEGQEDYYEMKQKEYEANVAKYSDYRTYFKFELKEKSSKDENVKAVSTMQTIKKDSGGEKENPKYVALFTGFLMLCERDPDRSVKIALCILDEAFRKLDLSRSKGVLDYLRSVGLQAVLSVPDKDAYAIYEHVDSITGLTISEEEVMQRTHYDQRIMKKSAATSNQAS